MRTRDQPRLRSSHLASKCPYLPGLCQAADWDGSYSRAGGRPDWPRRSNTANLETFGAQVTGSPVRGLAVLTSRLRQALLWARANKRSHPRSSLVVLFGLCGCWRYQRCLTCLLHEHRRASMTLSQPHAPSDPTTSWCIMDGAIQLHACLAPRSCNWAASSRMHGTPHAARVHDNASRLPEHT